VCVQAVCFGCDIVIEAADSQAVADRFVEHAAQSHAWSYPEESLRNYARNCAEAPERLTGSTERLAEIGAITIHPVTEDRIDDWLHFFDHDGFAGHPDWATCYCFDPHDPGTPDEPERLWSTNRRMMVERLRTGGAFGYLAYVGGRAAGWVNASLRSEYGKYRLVDPEGPAPSSVIGVSCFVIAPPFRRHGIAAALLDRVITDAAARGATWLEGYPHSDPENSAAGHFRGPRSMYDARGFTPIQVREHDTVVRRPVG
jgi:GNAT superfamily N-acetyltransferase/predicted small metal-binding protein